MQSPARALSAVMTAVLMALLLAGCGDGGGSMTYSQQESDYAVGCSYSANIGTLTSYCTR
jgi:hypothetical protein